MKKVLELFPPSFDYIQATATEGGTNLEWQTRDKYRLTPAELIRKWADPEVIIGVRPTEETQKLIIDIDRLSKYHAFNNHPLHQELLDCLETIGLSDLDSIRSSASDGHHLVWVLEKSINSFDLACIVHLHLEENGFEIAPGQIEIIPNVKSWDSNYNAIRIPFQAGSELLDSDYNIIPQSHEDNMAYLVSRIENNNNDLNLLQVNIRKRKKDFKKLYKRYGSIGGGNIHIWHRDWSETIRMGWVSKGLTNTLLKTFTAYAIVFEGITDPDRLCQHIKAKVEAAPGYQQFCGHIRKIDNRIRYWVKCCLKWYYPLGSRRIGLGTIAASLLSKQTPSTKRHDGVVERITNAIAKVIERLGALPTKLTERLNAIRAAATELGAGISEKTLYRAEYKHLWREPKPAENHHQEIAETAQIRQQPETHAQSENHPNCSTEKTEQKPASNPDPEKESPELPPMKRWADLDVVASSSQPDISNQSYITYYPLRTDDCVVSTPELDIVPSSPTPALEVQIVEVEALSESLPTGILPIDDPTIQPLRSLDYRDYRGEERPWRTADEFYRFCGYMLTVAKRDKSIINPYAWTNHTVKRMTDIDRYWFEFSGRTVAQSQILSPLLDREKVDFSTTKFSLGAIVSHSDPYHVRGNERGIVEGFEGGYYLVCWECDGENQMPKPFRSYEFGELREKLS